jgi:hypothetical protein
VGPRRTGGDTRHLDSSWPTLHHTRARSAVKRRGETDDVEHVPSKRRGPRLGAPAAVALVLLAGCTVPNPAYRLGHPSDGGAGGIDGSGNDAGGRGGAGGADAARDLPPPAGDAPGDSSSLVGWWKFDESPGASMALDSSGLGHHGTLEGLDPDSAWVAGRDGGALSQPIGGQGGVRVPLSTTLQALRQITVAAWMKRVSASTATEIQHCIASQQDDDVVNAESFNFLAYREDLQGFISTTDAAQTSGSGPLGARVSGAGTRETWTHVAMTYDGAAVRLFRNGEEVGSAPITRPLVPTGKPFYLGVNKNGARDQAFEGELDDIVIYRSALAASAIRALAGGTSPASF